MKRHYEIMRTMRTKILHSRELSDSVKSIFYVQVAIRYRVSDLTGTSTTFPTARDAVTTLT